MAAAGPFVKAPPGRGGGNDVAAHLKQKDEEILFLQRALMKQVELAAQLKKQDNELRREFTTCQSQLELLVALENEDGDKAMRLRQEIIAAKFRATQEQLEAELGEARSQIGQLQEMVMLQRQVRFSRAKTPDQEIPSGLRTVTLSREPGQSLGIMLFEDPDGDFDCRGIRIAGVRVNSPAAESRAVFMGDAIVAVNDYWCLESSYREVMNVLRDAGDLVVLSLASAVDVDKQASEFFDSDIGSERSSSPTPSSTFGDGE